MDNCPTRRSVLRHAVVGFGVAGIGTNAGTTIAVADRNGASVNMSEAQIRERTRARTAQSDDLTWPEYGYDPRNGSWIKTDLEPATDVVERWRQEFDAFEYGRPPVLTTSDLVFLSGTSRLDAYDPESGSVRWSVEDYLNVTPITVRSGRVYAHSNDTLVTFDARSGDATERGTLPFDPTAVTIRDDVAYLTGFDSDDSLGSIAAVSLEDASRHWRLDIETHALSRPAVTSDAVFVGAEQRDGDYRGGVVAIEVDDGTERWRTLDIERVQSAIAVADGRVFATSADGPTPLTAFDAATGEIQWRSESMNGTKVSPTLGPDHVYYGTTDEVLTAIDPETGETEWELDVDGRIEHATPALVGETLYVGTSFAGEEGDTATLSAIDRQDGTELWRTRLEGRIVSPPAVYGDQIVVLNSDFGYTEMGDRLLAFSAVSHDGPAESAEQTEDPDETDSSGESEDGVPGFGIGTGALGLGAGLATYERLAGIPSTNDSE